MHSNDPRKNECWLLVPRPGDPETGVAVLVLEIRDEAALVAPLFMDDDEALPGDRKLVPEPVFLAGESWVALEEAQLVPVSGLSRRLGEIPLWQAARLRDAGHSFPGGLPLLAWLDDGRVGIRKELRGLLQSRVPSRALGKVVDLGQLVYDAISGEWARISESIAEPGADPALRAQLLPIRVRGSELKETELRFVVPGGNAELRLEPRQDGWIAKLRLDVPVSEAELVDGNEGTHIGEQFDEWRIFGEDAPVAPGECRLSWRLASGEAAAIAIVLPSPEEAS